MHKEVVKRKGSGCSANPHIAKPPAWNLVVVDTQGPKSNMCHVVSTPCHCPLEAEVAFIRIGLLGLRIVANIFMTL